MSVDSLETVEVAPRGSPRARGDLAARARRRRSRFRADRPRAAAASGPCASCSRTRRSAPVTINNGLEMRAWYDIVGFDAGRRGCAPGSARARPRSLGSSTARSSVASRPSGSCSRDSRRAARSRCTSRCASRGALAGVIALSTYLPLAATLAREKSAANAALPIFMAHGSADPVIPLALRRDLAPRCSSARATRSTGTSIRCRTPSARPRSRAIGAWLDGLGALSGSRAARARTTSRISLVSRALGVERALGECQPRVAVDQRPRSSERVP